MTTKNLSENIEYDIINNAEGYISLIRLREVENINDGCLILTSQELKDLYHKVFS